MLKTTFGGILVVGYALLAGCGGGGDGGMTVDSGVAIVDGRVTIDARPLVDSSTSTDPDGCGPNGSLASDGFCDCDLGYHEYTDGLCSATMACAGADDALEPNDTPETGTMWTPATMTTTMRACPDDEDWFKVHANAGQTIDVTVNFTAASGDIDTYLWVAGSDLATVDPIAMSELTTAPEHFSYLSAAAGDYWLLVYAYDGAQNTYGLVVTVTP